MIVYINLFVAILCDVISESKLDDEDKDFDPVIYIKNEFIDLGHEIKYFFNQVIYFVQNGFSKTPDRVDTNC